MPWAPLAAAQSLGPNRPRVGGHEARPYAAGSAGILPAMTGPGVRAGSP
jgi:hypothetical protein